MQINRTKRGWKKLVTERCRTIMYGAEINKPLGNDDTDFLIELLQGHEHCAAKVGAGIRGVVVRDNEWNKRTFWIVRVDGTETDFSFNSCMTPPTPAQQFRKACRTAVVPDVLAFKNAVFDRQPLVTCPVSGETVTRDTAHIDHAGPWPFESIATAFATTFSSLDRLITPTRDGDVTTTFANDEHAAAFRAFHNELASLRVVSAKANLSLLRRGGK